MEHNQCFDHFKQDPVYLEFLSDNFNLQNAMTSINNLAFTEKISKISFGIDYMKSKINQLTSKNCETFFQRRAKLDELYDELQFIYIKSQNLSKTLGLIKSKFESPYQQLSREIILLSRLQKTCDLLRKMLRIMHLMGRIEESNLETSKHEQSVFIKEIVKLSQYINEIDGIIQSDSENLLFKLNCLSKDLVKFQQTKYDLSAKVDSLLKSGLDSLDTNNISTALQVCHNLRTLNQIVKDLVASKYQLISQSLSKLFDINVKEAKLGIPSTKQNNLIKTSIRSNCKFNMETVYLHFTQISFMFKILKKRRDNQTQMLLIEFIEDKDNLLRNFWNEIIKIFSMTFDKLFNGSPVIKKIIESDYPKILVIILEYWKRIVHDEQEIANEKSLRSTIAPLDNAYLSNSLSLLFESVNRIFTSVENSKNQKIESVPSEKDVDMIIKDINNEILAANFDGPLTESVCRNIVKTINLFVFKFEQLVSNDGDATQVIGKFTINQRHNSLIIYILNYFATQLKNLISNYSSNDSIRKNIEPSLKSIDNLILNIFEPFILSIQNAVEDIILTIHNEKYDIDDDKNSMQCSLYMKELQRFLSRVSQDYFQQYPDTEIIKKRIHQMTAFIIDFFLLQNCLIRPISQMGRWKISIDFTQLEVSIVPICQRLGDVGRSFQILKAFKTLLLLSPEEIAHSPIIDDPVPYYLVIHFLISNYASEELKSPHKFKEWSISRYSKWLISDKTDEEKLSILRNSLNAYVAEVKKSQKKSFFPIYPLLMDLMRKANEKN